MNNKEYKAIVKKAAKRFERLQELELKAYTQGFKILYPNL